MNNAIVRNLPTQLDNISRIAYTLIGAWLLAMVSLPIFKWTVGTSAIIWGVNATTVLQATAVIVILATAWGLRRALVTAGTVMLLTWAVEALGTATGFPFGHYDYTQALQPQIANVPVLISIAWLMMLPSSWAVAYVLNDGKYGLRFILTAALAMTAWDLFLDPQMVAWDLWRWELESGGYFGIPWVNFVGWIATAALVTAAIRPKDLPIMPLFVIYVIVWVLQTIGQALFWGQPGPALVVFIAMGIFVLLSVYKLRQENG
jgi:uncharacterized membrane protein